MRAASGNDDRRPEEVVTSADSRRGSYPNGYSSPPRVAFRTTDDVAFTYEFLQDTSLGELDTPVPTPWQRGAVSLVDRASANDGELSIEFATDRPAVARRDLEGPTGDRKSVV